MTRCPALAALQFRQRARRRTGRRTPRRRTPSRLPCAKSDLTPAAPGAATRAPAAAGRGLRWKVADDRSSCGSSTSSKRSKPTPSSWPVNADGVADEHDRQPIGLEVLPRHALDVVGRDRVHPLAIGLDVAQRQAVEQHVQHLRGDRVRRLDRERETCRPGSPARSASSRCDTGSRCSSCDLVDDQPQHFGRRVGARVGFGHEVAALLQRLQARPTRRR